MKALNPNLLAPMHPPTRMGEVWTCGRHRIMCGDATLLQDVAALFDGTLPDCVMTDPPYSSGGFQDQQRKATSSKGSAVEHEPIRGDMLSARGYQALMRATLSHVPGADLIYLFGDWRMWGYNFDLMESLGRGVRAMIVWDKGTPGMGQGWRSQHEIIMVAARKVALWNDYKRQSLGNVIQCPRTRNKMHTTQKPVALMERLLQATPFARVVYDPFAGSGTTMVACERRGPRCLSMEIDTRIVDIAVRSWEVNTGLKAVRSWPDDRGGCECVVAARGALNRAEGVPMGDVEPPKDPAQAALDGFAYL